MVAGCIIIHNIRQIFFLQIIHNKRLTTQKPWISFIMFIDIWKRKMKGEQRYRNQTGHSVIEHEYKALPDDILPLNQN